MRSWLLKFETLKTEIIDITPTVPATPYRGVQLSQQLVCDSSLCPSTRLMFPFLSICRAFLSCTTICSLSLARTFDSKSQPQSASRNAECFAWNTVQGDIPSRHGFVLHNPDFKARRSDYKAQQSASNAEHPSLLADLTVTLWFHCWLLRTENLNGAIVLAYFQLDVLFVWI